MTGGAMGSVLRNLKWVVDFDLLEWHYLEGTINQKLDLRLTVHGLLVT